MTSLEYIRNKISKKIKTINEKRNFMTNCKKRNIPFNIELTYEDEKELEYLRQVESELEAWEVVKHTIYKRKMGEESFIQVMGGVYNEGQCWTSGINPYEIIKKALEVSDES